MKRALLVVLLLILPAICRAENCPWITPATAYGALGVPAGMTSNVTGMTPASCSFQAKDGSSVRSLVITVETAKEPERTLKAYEVRCGRNVSPLQAIGNEAVICHAFEKKHVRVTQAFGRVREHVFSIHLSTSQNDLSLTKEMLDQKARLVAEQVAGNLY